MAPSLLKTSISLAAALIAVVAAAQNENASARAVVGLEIAATGDVSLGRAGSYPAGGAEALFAGVRAQLRAPVSVANLETALIDLDHGPAASKCGTASTNCFAFGAPESFAFGLRKAGFTAFSVANNHTNDYGAGGRLRTVAALARAGLHSTGAPDEITIIRAGGLRVALIGFAPYASSANLLDLRKAQRLVRIGSRRADIVLVTMHVGAEGTDRMHVPGRPEYYLGEARGDSRAFGHAVVDAGADLVVGHGPHVLRGIEWYHGRLIAHSLGNFSGHHNFLLDGALSSSAILRVRLDRHGGFLSGRLVSIQLVAPGTPTIDSLGRSAALISRLSREDFGATAVRLDRSGAIAKHLAQP